MILHSGTFEVLANRLVEQGFMVVATDMRGYGRWYHNKTDRTISYEKTEKDLISLGRTLKQWYPKLPIFYVGESLGASMAVRLASRHPDLVDGLVLSSPGLKPRLWMIPQVVTEVAQVAANFRTQLNLKPYIQRFSSDDPRVSKEILNDPLARTNLSAWELILSRNAIHSTLSYVKAIDPRIPVLIVQGSEDRTLKANAVVLMLSRLRSTDQTVKWFPHRGHVLIETAFVQPAVAEAIEDWLQRHVVSAPMESATGERVHQVSLD
jgi:alpha-beta hydrolase superfamily lysophospholipase